MRLAVILASSGRAMELSNWSETFKLQSIQPSKVLYSVVSPDDLPEENLIYPCSTILYGDPGLPKQRNRGLDFLSDSYDLIAFFDDDYVACSDAFANIMEFFKQNPEVVGINGVLLADGINTAGISYSTATQIIKAFESQKIDQPLTVSNLSGLYGCNMVYRASAIRDLRFDENLPLYGWQEDVDFASRVSKHGRIVGTNAFAGVHQGVKLGRSSGVKLGYSQISNPLYLARKGSITKNYALRLIVKNVLSNHLKYFLAEPWIDRKGRAAGNWIAICDVVLGRSHPNRILDLN
ncbi:glycosyltransferase family 2 protein [Methylobacterium pseudosasicola]|uniref:Glycosyltransferase, GT2 family n=1 Tax=Methylobacterium pseudosasicola TaxID=582667 RepID=A0A1I4V5A8_9HYPH|nr:glycosyl transferase [Methylobacterium pseudosasicola]SFM96160.1 Glycosyltransferase, GT2 family [Methylobacterium pseudosasicola]